MNSSRQKPFRRNPNYVRHTTRTGPVFPWVHDPVGRVMKIVIGIIGDNETSRAQPMYPRFLELCPWAPKYYESIRGVPLTAQIVHQRWYLQNYSNGTAGEGGTPGRSREHYLSDPKLKCLAPAVLELVRTGRPIALEECETIARNAD